MKENNKKGSDVSHEMTLYKNIKINLSIDEKKYLLKNLFFYENCKIVAIANSIDGKPQPAKVNSMDEIIDSHLIGTSAFAKKMHNGITERRAFRVGAFSLIPGSNRANKIVIDLDGKGHKSPLESPLEVAKEIYIRCRYLGLKCNVEISYSGNGLHLWIFSDEPILAYKLRALGFFLTRGSFPLATGGIANPKAGEGIEIFPKQDQVPLNSYGNLVWLPWYHLAINNNNQFINMEDLC